jgi:hypothetical protein
MRKCDMHGDCLALVTHVDEDGWVYCTPHGEDRQADGWKRCRKLRAHELRRIERSEPLARY